MSREFKFRFWDNEDKTMCYDVGVSDLADLNGQFTLYPFGVFMQYIGIKDRAGNKIFDGDIVENKVYGGRWQVCGPRKDWDYCGFVLRAIDGQDNLIHFSDKQNLEVIGNIYQHPELIQCPKT